MCPICLPKMHHVALLRSHFWNLFSCLPCPDWLTYHFGTLSLGSTSIRGNNSASTIQALKVCYMFKYGHLPFFLNWSTGLMFLYVKVTIPGINLMNLCSIITSISCLRFMEQVHCILDSIYHGPRQFQQGIFSAVFKSSSSKTLKYYLSF